jgi:LmbE family N-acetylglucosaminyl deacetylase
MKLQRSTAEIYIPDGLVLEQALKRTTHLAVAAHPDDLEIMAPYPILECFEQAGQWFTGVVVTDGRGSPRRGGYASLSDEDMRRMRLKEQCKAAQVGEYGALIWLDYPSQAVKDTANPQPAADLHTILQAARPRFVYTHSLADRHDTHVAVALRTLTALRQLPEALRPEKLFGGEVWGSLDWLVEEDKVVFEISGQESLQAALLGVFQSQVAGGKRYDLAALGRQQANATFHQSYQVDQASGITFAMDMTALVLHPGQPIEPFVQAYLQHFSAEILERLHRLS